MGKLGDILKKIPNARWIAHSIKPFSFSIVIIVVVQALLALVGVAMAIVSKNIIDFAVDGKLKNAVLFICLFAGIIVINLVVNAFLSVYSMRTVELYSNFVRNRIFSRLINIEWLQVSRYHTGDLLTRLTSDIGSIASGTINILPQIIALGVQLAAAFFTLLSYEPQLALFAFIMAPITVLVSRLYARKLRKMHIEIQETESTYRSNMQEYLQNILILKTFNMEENSKTKVSELQKKRLDLLVKRSKTGVLSNAIITLGYWAGYLLAFGWGAVKLANNTTTYGNMTLFLQLVGQIQSPFMGLSRTLPQIIAALASAGRLIELEALDVEDHSALDNIPTSAGIRFRNVAFQYANDEIVLNNVNFQVDPGDIVALVGTSGEGKTTILRLILALIKPNNGEVTCFNGNKEEYKISYSTRNWFSYVPQGNTLFSGTIADNLRTGNPDADEGEMEFALGTACAKDFVDRLPEGINTVVGEKAYGLSEGQAQRIAIARALLRKSPIIVLDEATSALDIELEERLVMNLKNMTPKRTCIIITHRNTALGICNKIYKLKDGLLHLEAAV